MKTESLEGQIASDVSSAAALSPGGDTLAYARTAGPRFLGPALFNAVNLVMIVWRR
jgi:hypothetical protein